MKIIENDLGNKTKKGFFWDLGGSFFRQFASVFISILLARLLSPQEFGIIGMALVFISITEVFIDVGFTSALIQKKEIKNIVYSSIFFLNLGISVLLSIIIVVLAPFIADFYEEPKVGIVLYYLALIPVIGAFGTVQATILTKRMDFKSLSIRNIGSAVVGGAVGVIGALFGMGIYSLVLQQIVTVLVSTILLWSSTRWYPKFEFSKSEVFSLFGYSSYVFFDQVLRQIFNKIDTIFVGKVFSAITLGFYSRAESLKAQINSYTTSGVRKVMFPVLSKLQNDDKAFKKAYYKVFNVVSGGIVLLVGPIFFLSEEIIIGLLGTKWKPSVVLFQILILGTFTSPHIGMMAKAVLAKGYSKLKFKIGIIQRILKLAPLFFGIYFGIEEFAMAVVGASTTVFFVYAFVVDKKLNLSFNRQMKNILMPNIVFLIFILFFYLQKTFINNWLYTFLFLICNIVYLKMLKHESYFFIINTIKSLIGNLSKFKNK